MNLAIGGAYGGVVNNSVFPADLQIDYVRYYNLSAPGSWTNVTGATVPCSIPSGSPAAFYRLESP